MAARIPEQQCVGCDQQIPAVDRKGKRMSENELFKTTLMGGYDKDDVMEQMRKMKETHTGEITRLAKEIQKKNSRIEELTERLVSKEEQKEQLERNIKNKYQKYIDHYESISRLVLESQIRAENIIKDAQKKADDIVRQAEKEAQKRIDTVQSEVDRRLADGQSKYIAVQEEMNAIVELINQAQQRFMASYKEVHSIISTMPESLRNFEDDITNDLEVDIREQDPELEAAGKSMREIERKIRKDLDLEDSLDDADDLTEEDLERFLYKHGIIRKDKMDE